MGTQNRFGATASEWDFFRKLSVRDLLPVVSNPTAKIADYSTLKDVGKTPSVYDKHGHAVGLAKWTLRETTSFASDRWEETPDYGICLQTREYRAIDVDINDADEAQAIWDFIAPQLGYPSRRVRANASKFLVLVKVAGDIRKSIVRTKHGIVEFLATGQQCIVAGTHPSGARYEWQPNLPELIPVLTPEAFAELKQSIDMLFGVATPTAPERNGVGRVEKLKAAEEADPLAQYLYEHDYVLASAQGVLHIRCPFESEHTSESAVSATSYFVRFTNGYENGHFHCLHAHCQGRSDAAYREAIGYEQALDFDDLDTVDFPPLEPLTEEQTGDVEVEQPKGKRFGIMTVDEFLTRPALPWLVKNLIPAGGFCEIYGPPSSGKTFFALDLAASIARGVEWRGIKIKEGKRVVYLCAEGIGGFRNRVAAYKQEHADADLSRFGVIADRPDILDKATVRELVKAIGAADLLVVDTFASVMNGDENSSIDMGKAIRACDYLARKTKAAVMLIHHSRKDGKEARGHSSLKGSMDLEIEVARFDNGDRGALVVKTKDGDKEGTDYGFRLRSVNIGLDEDQEPITSCIVDVTGAPDREKKKGKREKKIPEQSQDLGDLG